MVTVVGPLREVPSDYVKLLNISDWHVLVAESNRAVVR